MNAKDAIRQTYGMSENILNAYLGDLDDADLLIHPVEGQNCIAWQLGHLISSERGMVDGIKPGSCPALPEGFDQAYTRDSAGHAGAKFLTKAEYLSLFKAQREATNQVLEGLSDADLDTPGPERVKSIAPTVGAVFNLLGSHVLMHVGQFVTVRRQLKKPVAI